MGTRETIIYEALYNDCIYESADATISLHRTKQGARDALAKVVRKEREEHNKLYNYDVSEMIGRFGDMESWSVQETILKD